MHRTGQSGGFLGRLLGSLLKTGLLLMKNVLNPLKPIKNEAKKQKGGYLSMLLGNLSIEISY